MCSNKIQVPVASLCTPYLFCSEVQDRGITDKFAVEDFSIKILLLPVSHPELNPIEIVWGFVKRAVASMSMIFEQSYVEELARQQLNEVTAAMVKQFSNHALIEEWKSRGISRY